MRILTAMLVATLGCATSTSDSEIDILGDPPAATGKSDEPTACGSHGEVCTPGLCGVKYDPTDRNWVPACAATDGAAAAFVKVGLTGAVTAALDSRDHDYVRAVPVDGVLTNVLQYGCMTLPESTTGLSGPGDGVSIMFVDYDQVSWRADVTTRERRLITVNTDRATETAGVYRGHATYSDPEVDLGGIGTRDTCEVKIATDDAHGLSGSFTCTLPGRPATTASLTLAGEFNCPMSTLDRGVMSQR